MNAIELISQDLFDKVRSRFSNLQMGDENGGVTIDPTAARFFDFDFVIEGNDLGRVSISINDLGTLKVFYSQGITEGQDSVTQGFWFDFLREMRGFAKRRMLRFDTRDITKGNLEKQDFQYLAVNGSKEPNMNESSMYGSSKSSYRPLEKTMLIIRHNQKVGEDRGARSRSNNINAIFIQNEAGERFKYPFIHMAGAKAMQRHVANGGAPYDEAGSAIVKMSEQIGQLATFKRQVGNVEQLTSEAIGIVDKVGEKLQSLRHAMEGLSKQTHYEEWRESLETASDKSYTEIDETTIEDYKSKFTVSSFKEDLAQFFPLVYAIMQETGEVDLEDYIGEAKDEVCDVCHEDPCECDDEKKEDPMEAFENWADEIAMERFDNESNTASTMKHSHPEDHEVDEGGKEGFGVARYYEKHGDQIKIINWLRKQAGLPKTAPVYFDDDELVWGDQTILRGALSNPKIRFSDLLHALKAAVQQNPDAASVHDESTMEMEEGIQEAGYYLGAEDLPDWTRDALHRVARGEVKDWSELYGELSNFIDDENKAERIAKMTFAKGGGVDPTAQHRIAPPDDGMGNVPQGGDEEDDDSAFLNRLRGQARSGSIKPGADTGEMDEDAQPQYSARDVAETILSHYDRETGKFPLGETGVLTKIGKEFGDHAKVLADALIKRLQAQSEGNEQFESMKRLAGLKK